MSNCERIQNVKIDEYRSELDAAGRLTPVIDESLEKASSKAGEQVVYIAGALTGVDAGVKRHYELLSDCVAGHDGMFGYAPHLHGTDPVKHPDVTPDEVRDIDYLWAVVMGKLHLNSLAPTAHGNAIEEGWAEANNIPAVYLMPNEMRASRIVMGMRNIAKIITYEEFERDALPQVDEFLGNFDSSRD